MTQSQTTISILQVSHQHPSSGSMSSNLHQQVQLDSCFGMPLDSPKTTALLEMSPSALSSIQIDPFNLSRARLNLKRNIRQSLDTMKISVIVLCLLLGLAHSDPTIQVNFDQVETINQANLPLLERVEQKAVVNYTFTLSGDNQRNKFPDLDITFTLAFDQYVKIKYHTAYYCSASCYLQTHLVVDGVEDRDFRDNDYGTQAPSTFNYGQIFMKAGTHRVMVEYATNHEYSNSYDSPWPQNMMSVQYHRKVSQ